MTDSTHHVMPIDLDSAGPAEGASPDEVLEHTIAVTVLGVTGVHKLGTAPARLAGALRSAIGSGTVPGVRAGTTDDGLVVDVSVVAEYPTNVTELADTIRTQVQHAVGQLDDEPVTVNVTVSDVHGPFDSETDAADRVDAASAAVGDAAGKAKEAVGDAADKAKDAAGDAVDKTKQVAADVGEAASAKASDVADQARDVAGQAKEAAADAADATADGAAAARTSAAATADAARDAAADGLDAVADAADDTATADATGTDADVVVTIADGTVTVEVDGDSSHEVVVDGAQVDGDDRAHDEATTDAGSEREPGSENPNR